MPENHSEEMAQDLFFGGLDLVERGAAPEIRKGLDSLIESAQKRQQEQLRNRNKERVPKSPTLLEH